MDDSLCLCLFQVHRRTWWLLAISLGGPVTHGGRCCDRGSFEPLGWSHLRIMPFGAWVLRLPSGCMRRNWCRDMHFFGQVWTWASQVWKGQATCGRVRHLEFGSSFWCFSVWSLELWLTASDFPRQLLAYDLQVPYAHQVGKGRMVCSS